MNALAIQGTCVLIDKRKTSKRKWRVDLKALVQASVIAASLFLAGCSGGGEPAPVAAVADVAAPVAQPVAAPVAVTPTVHEGRVLVMLGDSLTAGFGLSPDLALPEQIGERLSRAGLDITVINAGVSGDTSANGLARYDWSVASADPDILVIALGANDYLLGLSADTTRANIAAVIERAQGDAIAVILAGLEPRSDAPEGSRDAAYAAIYPDLSATYGVPLYPAMLQGVRDQPGLLQRDGLHPTGDGVARMADQLSDFLIATLAAD